MRPSRHSSTRSRQPVFVSKAKCAWARLPHKSRHRATPRLQVLLARGGERPGCLGKPEHESASFSRRDLRGDRAAQNSRNSLDNRQTKADPGLTASTRFGRTVKRLENVRQIVGLQTDSVVSHRKHERFISPTEPHFNQRARCAVLAGVIEQIVNQLAQERQMRSSPCRCVELDLRANIRTARMVCPSGQVFLGP